MRRTLIAGGIALAAVLAAGAYGVSRSGSQTASTAPLAFATERLALPDVEVVTADGGLRRFRGELAADNLLVVTFNYTTCATICPVGAVVMKAVDLRAAEVRRSVRLLSITIDPATDTPRKMRAAAIEAEASPNWLWLTGRPVELDRLLASFGARAADIALHDPIFLIGDARTGEFRRIAGLPEPEEIMRSLKNFDR